MVDFSAAIPVGTVTTVIGPNGAGKSTLLRAVYGLNRHFGGSVRYFGLAIEKLPGQRHVFTNGCARHAARHARERGGVIL